MNVKIMVIEDNPQNAYLVKYLLEREGFAVHVAATAKDGLRWMKKSPPDCLLLDIQLPDMDGYSVAKEVRKHKKLKRMPIIALSSFAMPGDRQKALLSGCNEYITKPIQAKVLLAAIRNKVKQA